MDITSLIVQTNKYIRDNLKKSRYDHTMRVVAEASKLADIYGADIQKVKLAAQLHDMAKNLDLYEMNAFIKKHSMPDRYLNMPNLAHGKIAEIMAMELFDITDREVLNAVSYHTTGRAGMSIIEKIVFIADAIEPERRFPGVEVIRKAAAKDIDKACLMMLDSTIKFIGSKGIYIDPDTIEARDDILNKRRNI